MPTIVGRITNDQIILESTVSMPGHTTTPGRMYQSLLDTGAQRTLISPRIANQVGLVPIGYISIIPANGQPVSCNKYRIRLDIPVSAGIALPAGGVGAGTILRGKEMDVAELPYQPQNHDVLLGMDFLRELHLTIFDQNFILSI